MINEKPPLLSGKELLKLFTFPTPNIPNQIYKIAPWSTAKEMPSFEVAYIAEEAAKVQRKSDIEWYHKEINK